ncbi:MAG: hypothetical protein BRC42_03710, partial [Cyanobacteria bacterium QS_1_48_34]
EPVTQVSQSPRTQTEQWRRMTAEQEEKQWDNIWNNPLGIAALHRLAIEEFISPNCQKLSTSIKSMEDFKLCCG